MESLDLSWNKLRRRGAIAIAKGIRVLASFFVFYLVSSLVCIFFLTCEPWSVSRTKPAGLHRAPCRFAQDNVRLKTCNVSWNGFGPETGAAIADAIANNRALLELDISGNRLDYRAAVAIGRALKRNEELEILRVRPPRPEYRPGFIHIAT